MSDEELQLLRDRMQYAIERDIEGDTLVTSLEETTDLLFRLTNLESLLDSLGTPEPGKTDDIRGGGDK